MSEKVTLIIKAANQSMDDIIIESELENTVLYIKDEISKSHPGKPSSGEQRLIYSGKLLQDDLVLKAILRHPTENNSYTLHLVCSMPQQKSTDRSFIGSDQSSSSPLHIGDSSNLTADTSTDGLRHRFVSSSDSSQGIPQPGIPVDPATIYPPFSQFPAAFPTVPDPMQQFAAMQQIYAQYMASYMQYMQTGSLQSYRNHQEASSHNTFSGATVQTPNAEAPNQQPQVDPQAQQPNNQLRMNPLQGGIAEDEEEGAPRDWLDYVYFASRMAILLCIVYFYSTLTRFFMVTLSCIFIYMYQVGWLQGVFRLEGGPPRDQEPQREGGEADVNEGPGRNENGAERPNAEEPENAGERGDEREEQPSPERPTLEELPPRPSLLALSWTFLTSFFTSLLPEQQQIV